MKNGVMKHQFAAMGNLFFPPNATLALYHSMASTLDSRLQL